MQLHIYMTFISTVLNSCKEKKCFESRLLHFLDSQEDTSTNQNMRNEKNWKNSDARFSDYWLDFMNRVQSIPAYHILILTLLVIRSCVITLVSSFWSESILVWAACFLFIFTLHSQMCFLVLSSLNHNARSTDERRASFI